MLKEVLIGLVISRRYQLVHTKRSGGQIGLLELNVNVVSDQKEDKGEETYVVSLWGQQSSDKCRHSIHNGSVIAIKITQRRVSADQRILLTGQLLACTLPCSDEVEMMFSNGIYQINKTELTAIMEKTISLLKFHPQWLLLRSLSLSARNVSSFQSMASETKAVLFHITILVPINTILLVIEAKSAVIEVFDLQNEKALLNFQCHDHLLAQLSTSLPVPISDLPTLIDQQVISSDGSGNRHSWLVKLGTDGKWSYRYRLQRVAVMHSYQQKIKSLRFLHQSTMTLDTPPKDNQLPNTTTHQLAPQVVMEKEETMESIPELKYLSWSALEDLPSQQLELDPMQYFVLHVSLRALHLHGHTRDTIAMNISLDSRMHEVEEAVKYKDAMLTIGPPQHVLDFKKLRTTFISAPTLPTQHAFTLPDSIHDDSDSNKLGGNRLLNKSGSWPAVEDVIYALLNHEQEAHTAPVDQVNVNELQATKKRRLSETMVPSQSNSMMLFHNHSISHHWRLVAPSQAPPSFDLSHNSHLMNDKTLVESEHDLRNSHSNSSSTAQVLLHDMAITRLCGGIPAALVAWSLANNSSHSSDGANNALSFDYAEAVGEILDTLQAEIEQGMDALLVVQLLPMLDYEYHEDNGDEGGDKESVGEDEVQTCGEFVLSLHSLYS